MCGIVAYLGPKQAYPILINGLKRLEYRGYDSAGVALLNLKLNVYKTKGKVADLENFVSNVDISGTIGIAHTRWATHGEPNNVNAHPHYSQSKKIALIHNGIIENYASLRKELEARGYLFESSTDTEVLTNLIEDIRQNENVPLFEAVRIALNQVIGAYAIVVIDANDPNSLIAARKGSPLVIGIGKDDYYVASDATPIIEHTKNVVYLDDEEIALIARGSDLKIKTIRNKEKTPYIHALEMNLTALEKGGFEHFMLKEIYEQPSSIRDSMRGRLHA
ncbi:MAG TPA: class II glutamine amidotransferase, partial [Bacteroidales bacterium]|nr:class II glutamine amidotransferase [Bacteroidales bacterium]